MNSETEIMHPLPDRMLINGRWVVAASGGTIDVENPSRKSVIGSVPHGTPEDVDLAVDAARQAFSKWSGMAAKDRGIALLRIADAIEVNSERIARALAAETGNALRTQARPEVATAAQVFRYFGGMVQELKGETIPVSPAMFNYTVRGPIGVVGAVIPWNAPIILASVKIAPALCAGNTMVMKTAEDAPLAVLTLAEIASEHLPDGVLNILTGYGADCGRAIIHHSGIDKLSFTGSTGVGRKVMSGASERIIPVSLELGGKSPSIVYPDADEEWVAEGILASARFSRQSQSCTAGSRLFIHEKIFDSLLEKVVSKLDALKIGDALSEESDVGAIINKRQFEKVCSYIEEGIAMPGVEVVTGGLPPTSGALTKGYFTLPTIFSEVPQDWRAVREEIFGPVLCAIPWSNEDEVIKAANDSHYGLAAYVWTHDVGRGMRAVNALEAGFIQLNQGLGQSAGQSYGGIKQSGIGREYSLEGMLESYTVSRNIAINLNVPSPTLP